MVNPSCVMYEFTACWTWSVMRTVSRLIVDMWRCRESSKGPLLGIVWYLFLSRSFHYLPLS